MIPDEARALWLAEHVLPKERAICAWLRRRCPADLDPWDVLQETYAILAGLPSVDHIARPLSYAFQVAHSLVLRHHRRAQVRLTQEVDVGELELAADEPSPEQQVADRQDLSLVADLLAALPAKCRKAFILRRVEGLSQRAVAAQMGISESTVEKHIVRALRLLMAAIGSEDAVLSRRLVRRAAGPALGRMGSDDPSWRQGSGGPQPAPQRQGEQPSSGSPARPFHPRRPAPAVSAE